MPSAAHEIRPLFDIHVKPVLLWLMRQDPFVYFFCAGSTTKHVEGKAIGKVVELSASSLFPLAFPHCYARPTTNTRDAPLVLDAFLTVQDDSVTPVTRLSLLPVVPVIGFTEAK